MKSELQITCRNMKPSAESEVKVPHEELRQAINDAFKTAGRRLLTFPLFDATRIRAGDPQRWAKVLADA